MEKTIHNHKSSIKKITNMTADRIQLHLTGREFELPDPQV